MGILDLKLLHSNYLRKWLTSWEENQVFESPSLSPPFVHYSFIYLFGLFRIRNSIDSEPFKWFMELAVKAFLAARPYADSVITLVSLMLDTELPCFKKDTIEHLRGKIQVISYLNQSIYLSIYRSTHMSIHYRLFFYSPLSLSLPIHSSFCPRQNREGSCSIFHCQNHWYLV